MGKIKRILILCTIISSGVISFVIGLFLKDRIQEKKKNNIINDNNDIINKSNTTEVKIESEISDSIDDYNDLISGKHTGRRSKNPG